MNIDFDKYADGLIPAIVQDASTGRVLMLGFMNAEALDKTRTSGLVTFYSRSRQQLWTKGESSGNQLFVEAMLTDCDRDTILVKARPSGPICHRGTDTCFAEENVSTEFLFDLEQTIQRRWSDSVEGSYTSGLFAAGLDRIAQKVGEEAIELIIAAKGADTDDLQNEAADLIYHMLVLLAARQVSLNDVVDVLRQRAAGHGTK